MGSNSEKETEIIRPLCDSLALYHYINGVNNRESICNDDTSIKSLFDHSWYVQSDNNDEIEENTIKGSLLLPKASARLRRWKASSGALLLPLPNHSLISPMITNNTRNASTYWLRMKIQLIRKDTIDNDLICNTLIMKWTSLKPIIRNHHKKRRRLMIENNVRAILSNQILSSQEYFHNRRLIDTYSDSLLFVNHR